jgi:hypothetical protein
VPSGPHKQAYAGPEENPVWPMKAHEACGLAPNTVIVRRESLGSRILVDSI